MTKLENWKEGLGIFCYFGLLAIFVPRAREAGWGTNGICFVVFGGLLFVFLLYLLVKYTTEFIEAHRASWGEFFEFMGAGSGTMSDRSISLAQLAEESPYITEHEIDAALASNPYAQSLFGNAELDPLATRHLSSLTIEEPETPDGEGELPHIDLYVDERQVEQEIARVQQQKQQQSSLLTPVILGEKRRLLLAENFQPDANMLVSTGALFVGMPGSGKTVALARTVEQLILHFGIPCLVFDIKGTDFRSLVDEGYVPNGVIATPGHIPSMAAVLEYRLQVIFDLPRWFNLQDGEIYEDAGQMIARVIRDLMAAARAVPPEERFPCLVVLDEIHQLVPQKSPSTMTPPTAKRLRDAVVAVATTGRSSGITPFFATQRLALVDKDVIAGVETRILGKTDLDNDIERYREYVPQSVLPTERIRAFRTGEMVVCMNGQKCLVHFFNRETRHGSHSPSVTGNLTRMSGKLPREFLAYLTQPSLETVSLADPEPFERVQQGQRQPRQAPEKRGYSRAHLQHLQETSAARAQRLRAGTTSPLVSLPRVQQQQEEEPPVRVVAYEVEDLDAEHRQVYDLWTQGVQHQSIAKIRNGLGITHGKAYRLCLDLHEWGLIEMRRQQQQSVS